MKKMLGISSMVIAIAILLYGMFNTNSNSSIEKTEKDNELLAEKQYKEVFKKPRAIDEVQEFSKKQKFEKIDLESKELIASADKLIKDKNLFSPKSKDNIEQEKLDNKISHLQAKIEELR